MYCNNCGSKMPANATFCPECGQKVGAKVMPTSHRQPAASDVTAKAKATLSAIKKSKPLQGKHKKKTFALIGGVIAVIAAIFFGYNLLVVPNQVKSALAKTEFTNTPFQTDANVFTKTMTITANEAKVLSFISAASDNGYSMNQIGAEEQLASIDKALPGWTVQIVQTSVKDSPRVLWAYDNGKETVRYQNSNEYKVARDTYLQALEKQNASESEAQAAVKGAIVGGLIGSALRRY